MRLFVVVLAVVVLAGCGGVSADNPVSLADHYMMLVCQRKFDEAAEFFVRNALRDGKPLTAQERKDFSRRLVDKLSKTFLKYESAHDMSLTYSVGEPLGTENEVKVPVEWGVRVGKAEDSRIWDVKMVKQRGRWWFVAQ